MSKRFAWPVRPKALSENMVVGKNYRFTVLTDRLIRLEFDESGVFEDRASQSVFYRDFPKCDFTSSVKDGILTIETAELILTYSECAPFGADTLKIKLINEPASSWCFGEKFEDLGGTVKTLDTVNGAMPVGRGVCSRYGFSVIDDSNTLMLGEDGWIEVRGDESVDCYFFGYGYNYETAVADLYRLTGAPPMLPAYALGNWWSRYHAYTQQEYIDLMERFKKEGMPFSVGVVDMDWHIVDIPKEQQDPELPGGWTGYSWNKELFPDYKAFLKYLNDNNIKTSLNLHPADGVRRHEDMYEEMAKACGIDPKTGERVRLDILSPDFMEKYFDILHHPYENDGVNFWWMDWQQGTDYHWIHEPNRDGKLKDEREILDPLWMLNHLHILDISRDGKRPMFFSRYSGPGSQRYPVGFSGDTFCTWESLQFQPYFTATSSNIGYSWWSHDIGGHQRGYPNGELFTRWLQLGVFSPINRIHSSNSRFCEKEPWNFTTEYYNVIKSSLQLRHALFPYIYTMNYRNHYDLKPLVRPMYYTHPKCSAAYEVPNQFWFGSEIMVSSIVSPSDKTSRLASAPVYLPDGEWFDFFTGAHYSGLGGRKIDVFRPLELYPVFAKAGGIVPMANYSDNRLCNSEDMELVVFPGADNSFTLYEDEGEGSGHTDGAFCKTELELKWGDNAQFTIHTPCGDTSLIPAKRNWTVKFRGFAKDVVVDATVNGKKIECESAYDEATRTVSVTVAADALAEIVFTISGETLITDNGDVLERIFNVIKHSEVDSRTKSRIYSFVCEKKDRGVHPVMFEISGTETDTKSLTDAIREQLILTEVEYPDVNNVFYC